MFNPLIKKPRRLRRHCQTIGQLAVDAQNARRLRRDMIRANLSSIHRSWSRVTNRMLGTEPVCVKLDAGGGRALDFWYRPGTTDLLVLQQIFLDREYVYAEMEGAAIRRIVDLGSNIGVTALFWSARYPEAEIVCVEPDAGNFQILQRNLAKLPNRVTALHAAVAPEDGPVEFFRFGTDWGHSTVQQHGQNAAERLVVDGLSLNSITQRAGFDSVDLIKMDIEGAEDAVLKTMNQWVCIPRFMAIELHDAYTFDLFAADCDRAGYDALPIEPGPGGRRMPLAIRRSA